VLDIKKSKGSDTQNDDTSTVDNRIYYELTSPPAMVKSLPVPVCVYNIFTAQQKIKLLGTIEPTVSSTCGVL